MAAYTVIESGKDHRGIEIYLVRYEDGSTEWIYR